MEPTEPNVPIFIGQIYVYDKEISPDEVAGEFGEFGELDKAMIPRFKQLVQLNDVIQLIDIFPEIGFFAMETVDHKICALPIRFIHNFILRSEPNHNFILRSEPNAGGKKTRRRRRKTRRRNYKKRYSRKYKKK